MGDDITVHHYDKNEYVRNAKSSMKVREDGTVGFEAVKGSIKKVKNHYFDVENIPEKKNLEVEQIVGIVNRVANTSDIKERINKIENTLLNIELNSDLSMKIFQFRRQITEINSRLLQLEVDGREKSTLKEKIKSLIEEAIADFKNISEDLPDKPYDAEGSCECYIKDWEEKLKDVS